MQEGHQENDSERKRRSQPVGSYTGRVFVGKGEKKEYELLLISAWRKECQVCSYLRERGEVQKRARVGKAVAPKLPGAGTRYLEIQVKLRGGGRFTGTARKYPVRDNMG